MLAKNGGPGVPPSMVGLWAFHRLFALGSCWQAGVGGKGTKERRRVPVPRGSCRGLPLVAWVSSSSAGSWSPTCLPGRKCRMKEPARRPLLFCGWGRGILIKSCLFLLVSH